MRLSVKKDKKPVRAVRDPAHGGELLELYGPTSVDPVNEITRGTVWRTNASPIALPCAASTLSTPAGQSGFLVDLSEQQSAGNGGIGCRFDDHGIPPIEGRCDRTAAQVQGEVPRADHANDAYRLTIDAGLLAREVRGKN